MLGHQLSLVTTHMTVMLSVKNVMFDHDDCPADASFEEEL